MAIQIVTSTVGKTGRIYTHKPILERLWSKIQRTSDSEQCWLWTGNVYTSTGLGTITLVCDGKPVKFSARRVLWEQLYGEIPEKQQVWAECGEKLCCNPKHLTLKPPSYKKLTDPVARFWSKVSKSSHPEGCWIWMAGTEEHGYGLFSVHDGKKSRNIAAHRYSYTISSGPIADGMCVLHRCDVPSCVRPNHLFLGTPQDNTDDMMKKRRHFAYVHPETMARGEKTGAAKLTEQQVLEMRTIRNQTLMPYHQLGAKYGITATAAMYACHGKNWRSLNVCSDVPLAERNRRKQGCSCLNCRSCDVREFYRLRRGLPTSPGWIPRSERNPEWRRKKTS